MTQANRRTASVIKFKKYSDEENFHKIRKPWRHRMKNSSIAETSKNAYAEDNLCISQKYQKSTKAMLTTNWLFEDNVVKNPDETLIISQPSFETSSITAISNKSILDYNRRISESSSITSMTSNVTVMNVRRNSDLSKNTVLNAESDLKHTFPSPPNSIVLSLVSVPRSSITSSKDRIFKDGKHNLDKNRRISESSSTTSKSSNVTVMNIRRNSDLSISSVLSVESNLKRTLPSPPNSMILSLPSVPRSSITSLDILTDENRELPVIQNLQGIAGIDKLISTNSEHYSKNPTKDVTRASINSISLPTPPDSPQLSLPSVPSSVRSSSSRMKNDFTSDPLLIFGAVSNLNKIPTEIPSTFNHWKLIESPETSSGIQSGLKIKEPSLMGNIVQPFPPLSPRGEISKPFQTPSRIGNVAERFKSPTLTPSNQSISIDHARLVEPNTNPPSTVKKSNSSINPATHNDAKSHRISNDALPIFTDSSFSRGTSNNILNSTLPNRTIENLENSSLGRRNSVPQSEEFNDPNYINRCFRWCCCCCFNNK